MKIVYHKRYTEIYSHDPASSAGRIESILKELEGKYEFIEPEFASEIDILRVHTRTHFESIKSNQHLYELASLSAGGAIKSATIAMAGEPSFGLIRPPGHHASADHCWGFCFFNNIAIALSKLKSENKIERAFILDFDLHFGDGTANIFNNTPIIYFQPPASNRKEFIDQIHDRLEKEKDYQILAISAGFDRHVQDWGGQLTTEDYYTIGKLAKVASEKTCHGRRFAVLEGGYNHSVLGKNVLSFIQGLE